jgi:hypothetical protein
VRNARHHRAKVSISHYGKPVDLGADRAGRGHTVRGRGRPHGNAPFSTLSPCGRHHADVARFFGGAV